MQLEVATVSAALAIFAGSLTACGDDDFFPDEPVVDTDAGIVAPEVDAALEDAASDAAVGATIEQCQECIFAGCGPALIECVVDPTCRELATCVLTSGCLDDLQSCVPACLGEADLTPAEIIQQLVLLQKLATTCTSCFQTCQDALPGGLGGDGGLGGFGGFGAGL